jgi:hypothetical protein
MAHLSRLKKFPGGGTTCPAPMTRVALITLRNASGLSKDCDYVITDHVQGRLVAGTQIHLQAVSANKLSENVQVNTTYDNEAWRGIYDLDRGLVIELQDNRNNIARGINGTEVSNFDWGNTAITDTTVDNATWTSTIGSVRSVTSLTVRDSATLITTGWVAGSILGGLVVENQGTVLNMTNANVTINGGSFSNSTSHNLSGYTGGGVLFGYRLSGSSFDFSDSSSQVSLGIVTSVGSSLTHTGVTTGTITGSSLIMDDTTGITHSNGAGNMSFNRLAITGRAVINHTAGILSLTDYRLGSASTITQSGAGTMSLSSGEWVSGSTATNSGTANVNGTRFSGYSGAVFNAAAGSNTPSTLTGTEVHEGSNIVINASSTAGTLVMFTSHLLNWTIIQKQGIGNLQITDSRIDGDSRVTLTNTRGLTVTRCSFGELSQITQSGTGAVVDNLIDSTAHTRGRYQFAATGAAANTLSYCEVYGLGGNIITSGTSTGQAMNRVKANGSTITLTNNIANSYNNITVYDGSTMTVNGLLATKAVNNVFIRTASTFNMTACTVAGNIDTVIADAGAINVTNTAGTGIGLYARDSGTITFNGGTSTRVSKVGAGTITTNNFVHNNVYACTFLNHNLTANNANRASYTGLVSSVPLI